MNKGREFGRNSMAIVLVLTIAFSVIVVVFPNEVRAHPLDPGEMSKITFIDLRAPPYFRVAFTNQSNNLSLTLRNDDNSTREIVSVNISHVEPDGITEHFLKTIYFGVLQPGMEKTKSIFEDGGNWIPTQTERNWIHGEIYVKGQGNDRYLVNEFRESFNVVPGERSVIHIVGDWIINSPMTIENKTVIVDRDVYVNAPTVIVYTNVIAGDLTITNAFTINPGSALDMIRDNNFYPLEGTTGGPRPDGIHLDNASVQVLYNLFNRIGAGIRCTQNSSATIANNTVTNNSIGLHSIWSSPTITGNVISDNDGWGILCEYAATLNAGNDTAKLLTDNPLLGPNGLGKCIQYWALKVRMVDITTGLPIAGAGVNVRPLMGEIVASGITDSDGYVGFEIIQDYANNSDYIPVLNPYLIDYEGTFYPDWVELWSNRFVTFEV